MRDRLILGVVVCTLASAFFPLSAMAQKPAYPPTRKDSVTNTLHGVEITDPYRWLENADSPDVRAWVEKQNHFTEDFLGKLPGREKIRERLNVLLDIGTLGTPHPTKGRYFYTKREGK